MPLSRTGISASARKRARPQWNFRRERLRFVIARMNHETNTFSPLPTPLEAFSPRRDGEARAAAEGSRTAMGAFLDLRPPRFGEIEKG
ncbi:MAG: hypothetical protein EPN45_15475, partial [Rhizobiaceae bacterium]